MFFPGRQIAGQTIIHGLVAVTHLDQMKALVFDADRSEQGKGIAVTITVGRLVQ